MLSSHLSVRCRWRHALLAPGVAAGVGWLIGAGAASAAEPLAGQVLLKQFSVAQIFTFLFLMLGPFKIIGPFSKITRGATPAAARGIAVRATVFSCVALLAAAFLGENFLASYGIPLPVLALSAGLILFLVALLNILQQFTPPASHAEGTVGATPTPALSLALAPLAFPTIVTPYGIAALVVFLALSPGLEGRLTIGAVVAVIMLLNLIVMILTRHILPILAVVLPILGAVLGVIQVALGLQIINNSLRALGVV